MSKLIEWFRNRWACIDNDIDIPLLDYIICGVTIPIFIFVSVATVPIWGIPYLVYRVYFAERI